MTPMASSSEDQQEDDGEDDDHLDPDAGNSHHSSPPGPPHDPFPLTSDEVERPRTIPIDLWRCGRRHRPGTLYVT